MAGRDYTAQAREGIKTLQRWYDPLTGQWRTAGWWNAANALTAVIGYTQCTGDQRYLGVVERTFLAAKREHPDFIVSFYDDNGWWGLAWVAAYDLTGDDRYLAAARTIFANLVTGWDDTCCGGVWWSTDRKYKNAISNELFLALAARLHQRCGSDHDSYLEWAIREWDWFRASGLIGANSLINDGLTAGCENNGGVTWTYNQGVILGGLAALYEATRETAYLTHGEAIADAALSLLTSPASAVTPGVLVEPGEPATAPTDTDRPQFKGVFVRNLYDFYQQSSRPAYREFILSNARSIWDNGRNRKNQFGLHWTGPFDQADACRQSAAMEALNAAVPLAAQPGLTSA